MGDAQGSKVFEVSREVTNWTIPEIGDVVANDVLDYVTENYWTIYSPSGANSSFNGSLLEGGNKTSVVSRDEELAKVEMAVLALIFILTVLGNCVVLLGIFFRRQKMTRMYYFILHLSVADLITAFFNVLTQLFWEITYRFQGGNLLCKFVKYTQILGPYSSSYVLVMTALDRYQAICYPMSNCTWTAKRSKIMLGLAWTISLLCCLPQIFIFSYRPVEPSTVPPEYDCWATFPEVWGAKAYVTWYSITVFIIPLIILVFAYSCITRAIWINFNMKAAGRNHDNYERRMTRQDSDDGDAPSHYEHSQDDSVFQRDSRLSLRATASHSISANTSSKKSNINLYNPSKHFLTTIRSTSTSSTAGETTDGGNESTRKNKYIDSNKRSVNNIITTKTSTSSSCNTQSSTLSPSLSGRRMSASEDKSVERNKNSLYFSSQKMFVSGNGKGADSSLAEQRQDEEQLQLIPTEVGGSEQCHHHTTLGAGATSTTRVCMSCDKNDLDGNNGPGSTHHLKNGSVKFSGESSEFCQHGGYEKRCNHCQLACGGEDQLNMNFTEGSTRSSIAVLTNEMKTEVEAGDKLLKEGSPASSVADRNRDKDQNQSHRFSGKSSSRHLLLPVTNRFSRRGRDSRNGNGSGSNQNGKQSTKSVTATYVDQQPRTHSVKGISRAKIKTIKLTVTIICCYIFCSSPFIAAQLWYVYDPNAYNSSFFKGPTFTILTLLASLNSCVNPYIFLFFNPNLLQSCFHGIFRPKYPGRRFNNNGGSPLSRTLSQSKKAQLGVVGRASRYGSGHSTSGNRGQSSSRLTYQAGNEGSLASSTRASLAMRDGESSRSQYQVPPNNGFEKGYLEHVSEKSENINAVELVDSTPPLRSSPSMQAKQQDRYPPFGKQPCRVETSLDATKSHVSTTSTLIT